MAVSKQFQNATEMKKFIASILPIPYRDLRAVGSFEGEIALSEKEKVALTNELGIGQRFSGIPKMWVSANWEDYFLSMEVYALVKTKCLDPRVIADFLLNRLPELQ